MYCKLGEIIFDVIKAPEKLQQSLRFNYAEHSVIEGKPKLQYIGEELEELDFSISFHSKFCDPSEELAKLKEEAQKYEPLSFLFKNGQVLGQYVITEIRKTTQKTDGEGNVTLANAEIRLKEYSPPAEVTYRRERTAKINKAAKRSKTSSLKKKKLKSKRPVSSSSSVQSVSELMKEIVRQG